MSSGSRYASFHSPARPVDDRFRSGFLLICFSRAFNSREICAAPPSSYVDSSHVQQHSGLLGDRLFKQSKEIAENGSVGRHPLRADHASSKR